MNVMNSAVTNSSSSAFYLLVDAYKYVNSDIADPRQVESFWFGTPFPVLGLSVFYWLAVRHIMPWFMEKHQAYQLKGVLKIYNAVQMCLCIALLFKFDNSGYRFNYLWTCVPTDYSLDPLALNMLSAFEFTFMIKIVDLIETIFFCLRKKAGQVSFLHVYHHISTLLFTWISCKYAGGGMFAFSIVINAYVHLLMYSYYLLSSFGGVVQIKVAKIKPVVTVTQLVQLSFMIINHISNLARPSCKMSKGLSYLGIFHILFLIKLFRDFYVVTYKKPSASISSTTKKVL